MNAKLLISSILISALIIASMNAGGFSSEWSPDSTSGASMNSLDGDVIQSAVGNVAILCVLSGAVYLFLRGVCRSFGKM